MDAIGCDPPLRMSVSVTTSVTPRADLHRPAIDYRDDVLGHSPAKEHRAARLDSWRRT